MSERDKLTQFHALIDSGDLTEGYGAQVVVIGCMHCSAWTLERHRNDGRRVTIADRLAAVDHAREVHGITTAMKSDAAICPQCRAAPCEIVDHEDDGGTRWSTVGTLCSDCLAGT